MAFNDQGTRPSYGGSDRFSRPPRQSFDVSALNLKCCDCGIEIKELPFNPDPNKPTDRIRCPECQRKWRQDNPRRSFGGRGFGG